VILWKSPVRRLRRVRPGVNTIHRFEQDIEFEWLTFLEHGVVKPYILVFRYSSYAARCYASPSVASSVTFVYSVETNKHIFKKFSPL